MLDLKKRRACRKRDRKEARGCDEKETNASAWDLYDTGIPVYGSIFDRLRTGHHPSACSGGARVYPAVYVFRA